MKIIDLLKKIANGEEVPKQISLNREIYKWDSLEHFYANEDGKDLLELAMFYSTHDLLEMEVELIEDKVIKDQTIDIDSIEEHIPMYGTDTEMEMFGRVTDKMKEIIRAVKHLNKEIQSMKIDGTDTNVGRKEK